MIHIATLASIFLAACIVEDPELELDETTQDSTIAPWIEPLPLALPLATICKGLDRGPPCRAIFVDDLDLSNDVWSDGTRIGTVGSIVVEANAQATVCEWGYFWSPCALPIYGGSTGRTVNLGMRVWSIEVKPTAPPWYTHFDASNQDERGLGHVYPRDSELGALESEEIQGIAHDPDGKVWFLTDTKNLARVPVSADLQSPTSIVSIKNTRGEHFGDPDYAAAHGLLYVPNYKRVLTGQTCSWSYCQPIYTTYAWVEVYDRDLRYIRSMKVPGGGGIGWVAINPRNGLLYTTRSQRPVVQRACTT